MQSRCATSWTVFRTMPGLFATVLFATVLCAIMQTTAAAEIWIVSDNAHPVHGTPGARVIELDAPARVEAALSAGLPANLHEAAVAAQLRLSAGRPSLARQLASAYQAVADAWSLGVTTIPAVIVDRRYVVYGDPDAAHAVARIQAYREAHP